MSATNVAHAGKRGNICVGNNVSSFARALKVLRKRFGANGVGLRVKRRLDVLYVQHLVD